MNHPTEQLADFALGLLDAAAQTQVEAHLAGCASCRKELRALQDALSSVVDALEPVALPAGAWAGIEAKIMAGDNASKPLNLETKQATPPESALPKITSATPTSTTTMPLPTRTKASTAPWLLAASVAALLLTGAWGWQQQRERLVAQQNAATLQAWLSDASAAPRAVRDKNNALVARLWLRPDQRALLVAAQAAPAGRDYQAWGIKGGVPVSLGVLRGVQEIGTTTFEVVAISLEPLGGSAQPTVVLGGVPTRL